MVLLRVAGALALLLLLLDQRAPGGRAASAAAQDADAALPQRSAPGSLSADQCRGLLQQYYAYSSREPAPYTGRNMVYFLHIPRTAGRTFHSCLLRIGTPGRRRCPKAYDHLRINTQLPKCFLLSSHDDWSVVEQLPENTAVVSQVRDPVQRILSAYEFSIEVAARQLRRSANYTKPKNKVLTDDVWPWSYLVPFFVADIRPKVRVRLCRRPSAAGCASRGACCCAGWCRGQQQHHAPHRAVGCRCACVLQVTALKSVPLTAPGVWSEQRADDGRRYFYNKFANVSKWELSEEERQRLVPNLDPYMSLQVRAVGMSMAA
jgi:hypothetical protein